MNNIYSINLDVDSSKGVYYKNNQNAVKKTIFIAIAFGTSVRDVLRNETFFTLKKQPDLDIVILSPDYEDEGFIKEFGGENIYFENLHNYHPSLIERSLRQFHRALLRDKCKTIDLGNMSGEKGTLNLFTPVAKLCKSIFGDKNMSKFIHWGYKTFAPVRHYNDVFKKYNPDLVILTRVLNHSRDYPILRRAATESVPSVCLVSSWDNLTSKGFFPFDISSLVVWNEVMKKEAIELFNFPKEKIFISGVPRFDINFNREGFCDKKEFFEKFNLDQTKKLITYTTGSKNLGKNSLIKESPEPKIIELIAEAIQKNDIYPQSQLLVRLHPLADPEEYNSVAQRENVTIHIPGRSSFFNDRLFSKSDDIELGETMLYSDIIINVASTISIDAAIMDTPIICIYFDPEKELEYNYSLIRLYDFDHYAKLRSTKGINLAHSKESLTHQINQYLSNPTLHSKERQKIVKQQCHFNNGQSGLRIAEHILDLLK